MIILSIRFAFLGKNVNKQDIKLYPSRRHTSRKQQQY